ncbi:chloramphenicol phosphotransferase [Fusarium longipes]|uniref:Chloramphenicol phosphotransferase n=1 Tax=Fusarium longipes TaxID=694270 RepID=A0A395T4U0_9HYPO|nr:chloramphenicol phosphotransferase [Fusarium longipes]
MSIRSHSEPCDAAMLQSPEELQQPCAPNVYPVQSLSSRSGKIVVLNGFPGTGKLTILKRLQMYLPSDTTCLLDNHLLIDPVAAVIPDRSDNHHELRRLVRAPIFAELGKRAKGGDTILMTACLAADSQRDNDFYHEHVDIARKNDVPIYWINLHCDPAILEQ